MKLIGLLGVLVVIGALVIGSRSFADFSEPAVETLEPGDCFALDSLPDELDRVQRRSCLRSDVGNVIGWVDFLDYDDYLPVRDFNGILPNWCSRLYEEDGGAYSMVERSISWLIPTEEAWDAGERRALCYWTATA
jgi:hypothetical protein